MSIYLGREFDISGDEYLGRTRLGIEQAA